LFANWASLFCALASLIASRYRNAGTRSLPVRSSFPSDTEPTRHLHFPMPKITYIDTADTARTVDAEIGATVMETAIRNAVPGIEAECGGACACATCHVYVDEAWQAKTGEASPMEQDMLDFGYDVRPNSRLSCQIKVTEDLDGLVVRTPERQA
jgi:2Fe-2S ferredoxin